MKSKQKYLLDFTLVLCMILVSTLIPKLVYSAVANLPCGAGPACTGNKTCESGKCKGDVGANCATKSKQLTVAEWDEYRNTPTGVDINTKIDPADDCKVRLFCDNSKKCCAYGSCNWANTQPDDPNSTPDPPADDDDDDSESGDPTFENDFPSNDTEFGGGIQATNDISIDSGDATTGGSGAGSADRSISLPDTGLNDDNTSFLGEVERLINWTLGFIGILVFSMMLLAGFEYATAGGDEAKTTKAISRIKATVIGLLILFFAFVTTNLIVGLALGRI